MEIVRVIGLLSVSSDALARIGVVKVADTREKETINDYEDKFVNLMTKSLPLRFFKL